MSVTAYTGLPGSGKSHSVVEFVVLPALKAGRVVATNLALRLEELVQVFPSADIRQVDDAQVKADPDYLARVAVPGSVLVIDEAQQLWPSGLRAKDVPEPVLEFFTKHRHRVDADGRSSDIVLVTQNLANVATFARSLVSETFRSVGLGVVGSKTRFRVDVYRGAAVGPNPPVKDRVRQLAGKYRQEIWRFYQSHTQRQGDGQAVDESGLDTRGVIWRSPWLIGGAALALVLGVAGVVAAWGAFHPDKEQRGSGGAAARVPVTDSPPGRAAAGRSQAMTRWRITGEIRGSGVDQVFLTDGVFSVTLETDSYCDRDFTGFLVCQWEGQEVSNRMRRLPAASVLGSPPGDRTATSSQSLSVLGVAGASP